MLDFTKLRSSLPTGTVLEFLGVEPERKGQYYYVPCLNEGCNGKVAFNGRGLKQNLGFCLKEKTGTNILKYAEQKMGRPIRECAEIIAGQVLKLKSTNPNRPFNGTLELNYHDSMKGWCHPLLAQKLEIGYCKKGIMAGKITVALHDENGTKIGYMGKSVKSDVIGWQFPKNVDPSVLLYNVHRITGPSVFVTREVETCVKLFGYGLPVVATFGENLINGNQLEQLRQFKYITVLRADDEFFDSITYQAICSFGNFWRLREIPDEPAVVNLL